jgi:Mor family transcriptional regulator
MRSNVKVERNGQLLKCYRAGVQIIALAKHFGLSVTRTFEIIDGNASEEDQKTHRLNNRKLKEEFYASKIVSLVE